MFELLMFVILVASFCGAEVVAENAKLKIRLKINFKKIQREENWILMGSMIISQRLFFKKISTGPNFADDFEIYF